MIHFYIFTDGYKAEATLREDSIAFSQTVDTDTFDSEYCLMCHSIQCML